MCEGEGTCNSVHYTSGCASDCSVLDTAVVLNSPKMMWMMTSKLSDLPLGLMYSEIMVIQIDAWDTLIKVSMVSKNHS